MKLKLYVSWHLPNVHTKVRIDIYKNGEKVMKFSKAPKYALKNCQNSQNKIFVKNGTNVGKPTKSTTFEVFVWIFKAMNAKISLTYIWL